MRLYSIAARLTAVAAMLTSPSTAKESMAFDSKVTRDDRTEAGALLTFLPQCEIGRFFTSDGCSIQNGLPMAASLQPEQTLLFRVRLRTVPMESGAVLTLVSSESDELPQDTSVSVVPLNTFSDTMEFTNTGNELTLDGAPMAARVLRAASSHPAAAEVKQLRAVLTGDATGWPAYELRKAAVSSVLRGSWGYHAELRCPSVPTAAASPSEVAGAEVAAAAAPAAESTCEQEWVVMVKAGKAALDLQAAMHALPAGETMTLPAPMPGRALQNPSYTPLNLNQPVVGNVGMQGYAYYSFDAPKPLTRPLSVIVTPGLGDADLYVTVDGQAPSTTHWQYRSSSFFVLEKVSLDPADSGGTGQYCSSTAPGTVCQIRIGVYGYTPATFTITITSDTGPSVPISSGLPVIDSVPVGLVNYYSLASQAAGHSYAFSLSVAAGQPNIYVTTNTKGSRTPNATSSCWSAASAFGRASLTIMPNDGTGCYCSGLGCTYYIGIQQAPGAPAASIGAYVLIVIEEGDATDLVDGVPSAGVVPSGTMDIYNLVVLPLPPTVQGRFKRMVEIAVLPLTGDPDLYVTLNGRTPTTGSYDYRSITSDGIDYIAMRDTDPKVIASSCKNWTVQCTLKVGVYGNTDSSYILVSDTGIRPVALLEGAPMEAGVDAGYYAFFSFTVFTPSQAVVITVEPLSGYTATYVGSEYNNATLYPTADNGAWIWRSTTLTANVVVIEPTDAKVCPFTPCTYTIGVRALGSNATFTISARLRDSTPVLLAPGLPYVDIVELKDYSRYITSFDRSLGYLEVTVSPIYGDPDLYLALDNRVVTNQNYQYAAAESGQDDDIVVYPTDYAFNVSCGGVGKGTCTANIAVFGFSRSAYYIEVSNGFRVLADGDTTTGKVGPGRYSYFGVDVWRARPVTISVTPVAGDPDLYVSIANSRPTAGNSTWSAAGDSVEKVVVDPKDPAAAACLNTPPCRINIAVQAWGNTPCTFRIGASTDSWQTLTVGNPAAATIQPNDLIYFIFNAPFSASTTGLEFVATSLSTGGDVTLFVGNQIDPASGFPLPPTQQCLDPSCQTFTVNYATWDSGDESDRGEVKILANDPNLVAPGMYIVAAYSSAGTDILLTAALGNSIKPLTPGLPFRDEVDTGETSFFSLAITKPGVDVIIQVTPMGGDPDLFVSIHEANKNPTKGNADRSSSGYGIDQVRLTWAELLECQTILNPATCSGTSNGTSSCTCYIYAGVYGYVNSSFSIVATVDQNGTPAIRLLDGQPQAGTVAPNMWAFYYVDVDVPQGSTYSFALRTSSGDPDLYVTTDGLGPPSIVPPPHFQYSSSHWTGDELIDVQPGTSGYNATVRAWAGVFGYTGNCSYTLTFSTASTVQALSETKPSSGVLQARTYAYYSYLWQNPTVGTVSFTVTALGGNPDLYAAVWPALQPRFRPTTSAYTWRSTAIGSDVITIAPGSPGACRVACNLIIGVYCSGTAGCRFSVGVTNSGSGGGSIVTLSEGVPQSSAVAPGSYTYFKYDSGSAGKALTFRVTPTGGGDAQLVVTNRFIPGTTPTSALPVNQPGQFVWSSARGSGTGSTGTGVVSIAANDPGLRYNATVYVIGVYGVSGGPSPSPSPSGQTNTVPFSITASSNEIAVLLQPGVPSVRNYISQGGNAHFQFELTDTTQDLVISAALDYGAITIAVSRRNTSPSCTAPNNCGDATWTSVLNAAPGSLVRISAPSAFTGPCQGPFVKGPCTPSTDWKLGRYYIAVYGITNAEYAITAFSGASYETLVEGQPAAGSISAVRGAPPAIFAYRTAPDLRLPDVRFSFDDASADLTIYMRSCVDADCGPADQVPGPTWYEYSASVPAQSSTDLFITKYMGSTGAYCAARPGTQCVYFIGVYVAGSSGGCPIDPSGGNCPPTTFTLTGATQSGLYPNIIQQSSINNKVYSMTGNVPVSSSALYELYLDPTTGLDVTVDIQACTNGYPTLYVCNPSPAPGVQDCDDPFNPSSAPRQNTGSRTTAGSGMARWVESGVKASNYFLSVAADTTAGGPPLAAGNWMYQIMVSSGTAYYLSANTPGAGAPSVTVTQMDAVTFNLSWPAPVIVDDEGNMYGPAKAVTFYVYPASGGFILPGNPTGSIATTACGIFLWAGNQEEDVEPVATPRGQNWVVVSGLDASTWYQLAVLAECDRTCWTQSVVARASESSQPTAESEAELYQEGRETQPADAVSGKAGRALGHASGTAAWLHSLQQGPVSAAPNYVTQRVVYPMVGVKTGTPGGAAPIINLPVAGVVGIVAAVLVVAGAGGAFVWYKRSHTFDRTYQYSAIDLSGGGDVASSGISGGTAAGGAGVQEWGSSNTGRVVANPLVRAGPGLFSRIRQSFGPTQASSYAKTGQGLADSNYSSLEDRVEAYM